MNYLFDEFKMICMELNKIGIIPTLMGSLGLEFVSKEDWKPEDIDIHVPGDPRGWEAPDELRIYDWGKILSLMENLGYQLTDVHEHAFQKDGILAEYGSIDSLFDFAGVSESDIEMVQWDEIRFRVPSLKQFLAIYEASSKDSYRNENNNNKDFAKIHWLKNHDDNGTKEKLVSVAYQNALLPYHGRVDGKETNLEPLIRHFPRWNTEDADNAWCAAFVYHCLIEAGFKIPYSPDECRTCSLAGCGGLEEFAMGDDRIGYHKAGEGFSAEAGDIVIYDNVFIGKDHDHTGIVVGCEADCLIVAEGNVPGTNTSGIVRRNIDEHIRCYIRIPDGYCYEQRAAFEQA